MTAGFWIILAVGLIVLAIATLADLREAHQGALSLPEPDSEDLFNGRQPVSPSEAESAQPEETPEYITGEELAQLKPAPTRLNEDLSDAVEIEITLASSDFVNAYADKVFSAKASFSREENAGFKRPGKQDLCLVEGAQVLVCLEPISSFRELIGPVSKVSAAKSTLLIVAPSFAPEVTATLAANLLAEKAEIYAAIGEVAVLESFAELTSALGRSTEDLRAGSVGEAHLGWIDKVVLGQDRSWIVQ